MPDYGGQGDTPDVIDNGTEQSTATPEDFGARVAESTVEVSEVASDAPETDKPPTAKTPEGYDWLNGHIELAPDDYESEKIDWTVYDMQEAIAKLLSLKAVLETANSDSSIPLEGRLAIGTRPKFDSLRAPGSPFEAGGAVSGLGDRALEAHSAVMHQVTEENFHDKYIPAQKAALRAYYKERLEALGE
jgi:hypothetical protein